ncbi:speckle-type POZ protein-like A [Aphidius gifuensis]|uniref:speckle-type POZ protein-like A n=1 Tax=Aphidius gifuensis TaxID=684658 RepID=UPI001CDC1E6D|nr:speckle-type POZ protein-like A [Aphidius gifuensis]
MSVVTKKATQDHIELIKTNQDYVTGIETCKFAYEWTIDKVECDRTIIKSPEFSSHYSDFNDEWILEINPNTMVYSEGAGRMVRGTFVTIQLQPTKSNGFNDTSQLQTKRKIIVDVDKNKSNENIMRLNATQQLSADLKNLLLYKKSADVTIRVGQKSFHAIKSILGIRSPVFAAMFNHEYLKENKNNEVVIEDIDEGVFKEFLHYIYTGESPNIDKMPRELLAVADKYQVDCLKNICEAILCRMINCDNFATYKKKHPEVFVNVLEELLLTNKFKAIRQTSNSECTVL